MPVNDELRDAIALIVKDAMTGALEDTLVRRNVTILPTTVADRILALPEIAEALHRPKLKIVPADPIVFEED